MSNTKRTEEYDYTPCEETVLTETAETCSICAGAATTGEPEECKGEHCEVEVIPEPCPTPVNITIESCEDSLEFDAGEIGLESTGRILQVTVTIKNVCPHRRVALAVILTEVDEHGQEFKRGIKTVVVPAHNESSCRNVTVRCIKFVLPEALNVSGSTDSLCHSRKFKVRFIAHYIDNEFVCCGQVTV